MTKAMCQTCRPIIGQKGLTLGIALCHWWPSLGLRRHHGDVGLSCWLFWSLSHLFQRFAGDWSWNERMGRCGCLWDLAWWHWKWRKGIDKNLLIKRLLFNTVVGWLPPLKPSSLTLSPFGFGRNSSSLHFTAWRILRVSNWDKLRLASFLVNQSGGYAIRPKSGSRRPEAFVVCRN